MGLSLHTYILNCIIWKFPVGAIWDRPKLTFMFCLKRTEFQQSFLCGSKHIFWESPSVPFIKLWVIFCAWNGPVTDYFNRTLSYRLPTPLAVPKITFVKIHWVVHPRFACCIVYCNWKIDRYWMLVNGTHAEIFRRKYASVWNLLWNAQRNEMDGWRDRCMIKQVYYNVSCKI